MMQLPRLSFQSAFLMGRLLLAIMFAESAVSHTLNYSHVLAEVTEQGLPMAEFLLPLSIILELSGVVCLLKGRWLDFAALALGLFTLTSTFLFFPFWFLTVAEHAVALQNFVKNLALIGFLIVIYSASQASSLPILSGERYE